MWLRCRRPRGDRGVPPLPHPSDTPAPQKPYLCIGVMERRSEALGLGRKVPEGAKYPPPLEPAPPLTPIGTPVTPNLPRAGGPGPSRPGPMAARGVPPDPTAEEKLPHPIIQSAPRLQKTIRHPGKAHLPRLYWAPPPPAEAPMHRRPPHQSRAQAHAPTHASGGTPTRTQAPQAQP